MVLLDPVDELLGATSVDALDARVDPSLGTRPVVEDDGVADHDVGPAVLHYEFDAMLLQDLRTTLTVGGTPLLVMDLVELPEVPARVEARVLTEQDGFVLVEAAERVDGEELFPIVLQLIPLATRIEDHGHVSLQPEMLDAVQDDRLGVARDGDAALSGSGPEVSEDQNSVDYLMLDFGLHGGSSPFEMSRPCIRLRGVGRPRRRPSQR